MSGRLAVVGLGPGGADQLTGAAAAAIAAASDLFGYGPYLARLSLRADQSAHVSDNREELARRLGDSPASVIMKVGRNLPAIRRALEAAGKLGRAVYVERGTMERTVTTPLAAKADDLAPYFSLVLVPGWEGRP